LRQLSPFPKSKKTPLKSDKNANDSLATPKNNRNFSIIFHSFAKKAWRGKKKKAEGKHAFIRLEPLAHYTINFMNLYALHV
jgi:hypothetical protein